MEVRECVRGWLKAWCEGGGGARRCPGAPTLRPTLHATWKALPICTQGEDVLVWLEGHPCSN